ncbi:hypothetical protein [Hoeflea poritis]|uniref:Uncharacterized protein n=1 Tax=Hoeflea poritis TaxID=2993659 RepID=A0ABT4VT22_9HYPH|nr:hypothetical protein [Hoeflea poritis]MDA4847862.1 hypothetical protein [Hoeflea poritis]
MSLTFDMDSWAHLEHFRRKVLAFAGDDLNGEPALECANAGWLICDWVFKELGTATGFTRLGDFQEDVRVNCVELAYLQDLAVSYKHKTITMYKPRLRAAKRHRGAFSKDFSRDFDVSGLKLEIDGGSTAWMDDVLHAAVAYWDDYFGRHGL